ncbi:MAG: hypothetical protein M1813_001541 [Trichoglossum hirsutum]|nr:MAG: hypothetical protein M1813_001541 [Trichoglossum hirsutum]
MSPTTLPALLTPSLLHSIRTHTHLPKNAWYFIAGVTLSILNRADEIPRVFRWAIEEVEGVGEGKQNERLWVARRMREALVKSVAVGGLPKAINALLLLKTATAPSLLDPPSAPSPTSRHTELSTIPRAEILHRGQVFWDRTYGKISKRVMGQMDNSGTEDLGIAARLMYGYLLSNTSVLTPSESSFCLLAGLIPQDVNPQLKGHLKGALNNGATADEVRAVRDIVIQICEASGMKGLGDKVAGGWGWREEVANL